MNYIVEYYKLDSVGNYYQVLGTEYKRIFKGCTLKKIHNYLNRNNNKLIAGNVSEVNIYKYVDVYNDETYELDQRILIVG